ncbi:MAG TPA: DUF3037 domain-containing protein [Candidatus Acidoferrum sp.]|nr:DUF3037 domain-containing protein [Candidatus Acidoferrum sp.]
MAEKIPYTYRILRYTPNLLRDEWLNIGVLLEETEAGGNPATRRAAQIIEEDAEINRVRKLHPNADEDFLRALPREFQARLGDSIEKLDQTYSNLVQFSPQKAVLGEDFDAELDRLYQEHVAPPARARGGMVEGARGWIRNKLNDVFRRHRVLGKMQRRVRIERFTHPGDPTRIDYAYRNGTEGFLQSVLLNRDVTQAKVLAYTAEAVRRSLPKSEFTAITDTEPLARDERHQFIVKLFEEQQIRIVPVARVEMFAEELRRKLQ